MHIREKEKAEVSCAYCTSHSIVIVACTFINEPMLVINKTVQKNYNWIESNRIKVKVFELLYLVSELCCTNRSRTEPDDKRVEPKLKPNRKWKWKC